MIKLSIGLPDFMSPKSEYGECEQQTWVQLIANSLDDSNQMVPRLSHELTQIKIFGSRLSHGLDQVNSREKHVS